MSLLLADDVDEFTLLSGGVRDAAFMATEREIRRLQGVQAARIGRTEALSGFLDDGFHTVGSWLQAVTNSSRGAANWRVGVARLLTDMPQLANAVLQGAIGDDQLRLLTRLHGNDRCRPLLPESDDLLTGYARTLALHDFRVVCQRWQAWADPDGVEGDHQLSHKNRKVRFTKTGAGFVLHAEGPAHLGEQLEQILTNHEEAEFLTDVAQRADTYGDSADQHPLARTGVQRRFDAMMAVFLKGAATNKPGTVATTVNLITTPEHLARVMQRFFTGDTTAPDSAAPRQRVCGTVNGTPVPDSVLLNAVFNAQVRRVLTDTAGRVTELGRRQRLFTGAAREAVLLFGNRCNWPGCEHHVAGMHIDHLDPFANHGSTSPINGGVTCPAHNQAKERHRVTVKRDETGWHHYRPDGTEIAPRDG